MDLAQPVCQLCGRLPMAMTASDNSFNTPGAVTAKERLSVNAEAMRRRTLLEDEHHVKELEDLSGDFKLGVEPSRNVRRF